MATLTFCKQLKAASKAFVSKMSGLRPFLQKIRQKLKMRRDKASPSTLHVPSIGTFRSVELPRKTLKVGRLET